MALLAIFLFYFILHYSSFFLYNAICIMDSCQLPLKYKVNLHNSSHRNKQPFIVRSVLYINVKKAKFSVYIKQKLLYIIIFFFALSSKFLSLSLNLCSFFRCQCVSLWLVLPVQFLPPMNIIIRTIKIMLKSVQKRKETDIGYFMRK